MSKWEVEDGTNQGKGMSPLQRKIHNAIKHYRDGGIGQILQVISAYRVLPAWVFYIYEVDILKFIGGRDIPRINSKDQSYQYGVADKSDIDQMVELPGKKGQYELRGLFERFFDQGNKCFVVRKNGRILGYYWGCHNVYTISNDNYHHRQLHIQLTDNQVFFGNGFISPQYRLTGLFPHLVNHAIINYSKDAEFYTSIDRFNDTSRKSHLRFGFEIIGSVSCRRLAGLPYWWTWKTPNGKSRLIALKVKTVPLSAIIMDGT